MNLRSFACFLSICVLLSACDKEPKPWQGTITGKAQKGPFINGTSVSIFELNEELAQTGRIFNTQIENHSGSFNLSGVNLSSSYILFRVDGFYFNEVCGSVSETQITLNGVAEIGASTAFNLNVLTHLEKDRVFTLVQSGLSFVNAKNQAQSELFEIFGITNATGISHSELLDITGTSDGDAIMLSISCILQGHRTETGLSATLANFITDFRTDGELNDSTLNADLILHAHSLNLPQIRSNIEARYAELGMAVTAPNFEQHLNNFKTLHPAPPHQSVIEYPEMGNYGLNLLDLNNSTYLADSVYSLSANMPDPCMQLRVEISKISGPACNVGCWHYSFNSPSNWLEELYDLNNDSQGFTSSEKECDLRMMFSPGIYLFEYFEGDFVTPSRTKTIEFTE